MTTRYLLFCFDGYYPEGGWSDCKGLFDTFEEARGNRTVGDYDYYQIVCISGDRHELVESGRVK